MIVIVKSATPVAVVRHNRRMLDWPNCTNVRDVGGLDTVDGRRTRMEALIRSDSPHLLTPAALDAVRSSGIRRILDLRWAFEVANDPSPFAADPIYRHAPLLNDELDYEIVEDTYGPMFDHNKPRVATAFRALADAPAGGVLVHCHGGRDRTGGLVALALAVAGVPTEAIAAEFALTADTEAVTMLNTFEHLNARYGGVIGYLDDIGVPRRHQHAVRERLIA
jgi:protein-tyrosine phosphatase